jgi:hypothetical protein
METFQTLVFASWQLVVLSGAVLILFIAIYYFGRALARGEGLHKGIRKALATLFKNLP